MAVTRVNPATALAQLRQVGGDLKRVVTEAGPLASAPRMVPDIERFEQACNVAAVPVAVCLEDGTGRDEAAAWLLGAPATSWAEGGSVALGTVGQKTVRLVFGDAARPWGVDGDIAPACVVWRRGGAALAAVPPGLDRAGLVITTAPLGDTVGSPCLTVDPASPPGVLGRLLTGPATAQALDLLHAAAAAAALDRLIAVAGLAFDQELRGIRGKRALAQQRMAAVQARPAPVSASELLAGIRSTVQRTFTDFMRGLKDRFAASLSAPTSPLWRTLDDRLAGIDGFAETGRTRSVALGLRPADEEAWLGGLRRALGEHCVADIAALRDMQKMTATQVEADVAAAGGPPLVVQVQHLSEQRIATLLDNMLVPQRKFQAELPQQGPFQYLMMARRYQTVAFMLLSAFGLSFLRSYREVMIPLTFVLLGLGALQVVHAVRRERVDGLRRELDKLREILRAESRQMTDGVERGWLALVNQHLSDQQTLVLDQVEAAVREQAARATGEGADERQRLQRQIQGFEAAERKLALPQKNRDGLAQGIAQVRGELQALIGAAVRAVVE